MGDLLSLILWPQNAEILSKPYPTTSCVSLFSVFYSFCVNLGHLVANSTLWFKTNFINHLMSIRMWSNYHTTEFIKTADDTINTKHSVFLYNYIE